MIAEYTAKVEGGRIPEATGRKIAALLAKHDGKTISIKIDEVKPRRSLSANAFYWAGVVAPITQAFREYGNVVDSEEVHLFLKQNVGKLKQVLVTPDGEVFQTIGSTANLSKAAFSEYVEAVRVWAKEVLNLDLLSPDEFKINHEKETLCLEASIA